MNITIKCDRCENLINGLIYEGGTSGFYIVNHGYWNKYAYDCETFVCDACMLADPEYQGDYPPSPIEESVP